MRVLRWVLVVAFLAAALAPAALAQQAAGQEPGVVVADVATLTASVEAIDYGKRMVTLTGPEGNTVTVRVGSEVKNFDQIRQGDRVVVEHFEPVALFVWQSGDAPSATGVEVVEVARPGEKPTGLVVDTTEITASVEAIDYAKRTVSLKGPQGDIRIIKVGPNVERFDQVKQGDQVVVRHTEALAISVQKQ
jgi:hypothetical protein